MVAGVPFFDEVFRQLDCTYVLLSIYTVHGKMQRKSIPPNTNVLGWNGILMKVNPSRQSNIVLLYEAQSGKSFWGSALP